MGTIPAHHTPPSPPPDAPVCVVVVTGSAPLDRACDRRRATRCRTSSPPTAGSTTPAPPGSTPTCSSATSTRSPRSGWRGPSSTPQVERHPADKTCTDTELALALAARRSPDHLLLVAGAGDRLDHALAALGALGAPSLERGRRGRGVVGLRPRARGPPRAAGDARGRARHHVLGARGPRRVRRRHGHRCPLAAHRRDARPARRTRRVATRPSAPSVGVAVAVGIATVLVPGAQP